MIDTYRAQGHLNAENLVVMSVGKYIRIDGHLSIVHLSIVYIYLPTHVHIRDLCLSDLDLIVAS